MHEGEIRIACQNVNHILMANFAIAHSVDVSSTAVTV